ncbi:hypothetical protein PFHG_03983 [Plasmodium falciparum HB3]|uniref:Uncharacterized protein n=14 Tax=Plasmodium falciparum TaxID=5833 RepID=Q8IBF0_PLAF7|nr:Plasmodium exported protein, unknown function [Plasmodium falciparum 3D7]KAF4326737.1 hypothetical protein CYL21_5029 [Plasmodium falciparum NF54]KOB62230.1 hypothetical protein PFHG_03983 [Plasmodium falciparum HB3]KOB89072.1 hypothetical protein PFDG_04157 [Plasmodium falciparum Dd2]PKC42201.1 hypothetical protein CK202_5426 [Plasmodium falciparum NF54]CAD51052.1 Plasmodium exported protein, unknown function [Plasmodium falciparum 3D7]|eukprot:XP_001349205.1 Plasmodium exported protein, unknown function [Plasmodium falciparum 3D7]
MKSEQNFKKTNNKNPLEKKKRNFKKYVTNNKIRLFVLFLELVLCTILHTTIELNYFNELSKNKCSNKNYTVNNRKEYGQFIRLLCEVENNNNDYELNGPSLSDVDPYNIENYGEERNNTKQDKSDNNLYYVLDNKYDTKLLEIKNDYERALEDMNTTNKEESYGTEVNNILEEIYYDHTVSEVSHEQLNELNDNEDISLHEKQLRKERSTLSDKDNSKDSNAQNKEQGDAVNKKFIKIFEKFFERMNKHRVNYLRNKYQIFQFLNELNREDRERLKALFFVAVALAILGIVFIIYIIVRIILLIFFLFE